MATISALASRIQKKEAQVQDLCKELERMLREKYGREDLYVERITGDGLCVMIEDALGGCGVSFSDFMERSKQPDFDIDSIQTYL